MNLKFTEDDMFKGWYHIEEDFEDTGTRFHEHLGFLMWDEYHGYSWVINEDYSGIISYDELKQITDFIESIVCEVTK